jgi:AcrR family transcriptional regulator
MDLSTHSAGRRERNKQDKLERITTAARALFAEKGVSDVRTAEVAARADVASGTLFLYAKTKGELLLLAQNASYREAHAEGVRAAASQKDCASALISLLAPIVHCNREHVENGRTYLQEVVFGTSEEGYRNEAIELMSGTESAVAEIVLSTIDLDAARATELAHVVMAIMFLTLSSPQNIDLTPEELLDVMKVQFTTVLTGD